MELKTLTDRVLVGEWPLNADIESLGNGVLMTFATDLNVHVLLLKQKVTGNYQLILSKDLIDPMIPGSFSFNSEILYNA